MRSLKTRLATWALAGLMLGGCGLGPQSGPRTAGSPAHASDTSAFMWGVSTAGYQYERGESLSQWAAWDRDGHTEEPKRDAAQGDRLYAQDMDLARGMGCNAFRTSVEWSRIEPQEGVFDAGAIAHYREMLQAMHARGLTPVVTLHHFVHPQWFQAKGGWENPDSTAYFNRFVERVATDLGDQITWYLTFNEPTVFIAGGYLAGQFPPGKKNDVVAVAKVVKNMVKAHMAAYHTLHRLDPTCKVAFNQYSASWQVGTKGAAMGPLHNDDFMDAVVRPTEGVPTLDYVSIDYYTRLKVGLPPSLPPAWAWTVYPQGLYDSLKSYHQKTGLPVLVAENGLATEDGKPRADGWTREAYLVAHVEQVQRARHDGIPVLGYMQWSITDNYEWGSYRPRFGLFAVDCRGGDMTRVPTPAVAAYREAIAAGGVTAAMRKRYQAP